MSVRNYLSRFNVSIFPDTYSAQGPGTVESRYLILDHEISRQFRYFFMLQPLFFSLELVPHNLRLFRKNFRSLLLEIDIHSFRLHPSGFVRLGPRRPSSVPRHSSNLPILLPGFNPPSMRRSIRRLYRGRVPPRFIQNIGTVAYFPMTASRFHVDQILPRNSTSSFFRLVTRREVLPLRLNVLPRAFVRIQFEPTTSGYLAQFIRYAQFSSILLGNSLLNRGTDRSVRAQLFDYVIKFFLSFRLYVDFLLSWRSRFRFTGRRSLLVEGATLRFFLTRHVFNSNFMGFFLGRSFGRIDRYLLEFAPRVNLIYAFDRYNSTLIARYVASRLQIGYRVREVLTYHFLLALRRIAFGFRFVVKGRFSKKLRADYIVFANGNCPLGTFSLPIDYAQSISVTKYGTSSVKCWMNPLPPGDTAISTPFLFRGLWYRAGSPIFAVDSAYWSEAPLPSGGE